MMIKLVGGEYEIQHLFNDHFDVYQNGKYVQDKRTLLENKSFVVALLHTVKELTEEKQKTKNKEWRMTVNAR